jgi:hypothetical protein
MEEYFNFIIQLENTIQLFKKRNNIRPLWSTVKTGSSSVNKEGTVVRRTGNS